MAENDWSVMTNKIKDLSEAAQPVQKGSQTPEEWLKDQCNRYTNGQCHTRGCLVRGGYSGNGPFSYGIATCQAHESVLAFAERNALRSALHGLLAATHQHFEDHHAGEDDSGVENCLTSMAVARASL